MKKPILRTLILASAVGLLLDSCVGYPPAPPPRGRNLDQPPRGGNRYLEGGQYAPPSAPQDSRDPNELYAPPPPPTSDPAAVQPPSTIPPTGDPSANPGTPPPPTTTPPPAPPPPATTDADQLPFGIKVPGKPGFVLSPYDKTAGIVDVQGIAPGKKVKCPYTDKVFRVP
jgi:hypothetical protein